MPVGRRRACILVRPERLGQPEALWQQLADEPHHAGVHADAAGWQLLLERRPGREHLVPAAALLTGGDRLHGHPRGRAAVRIGQQLRPDREQRRLDLLLGAGGRRRAAAIGRPIANTRVYVLDANCSRCRSACRASCTSAATGWRAATSTGPS